jgi:hypothetical protein
MIDDRQSAEEALREREEEDLQIALNFLKALEIHANDHYSEPLWSLTRNGIGLAPLGNIMAIAAPMKSGKTWLMQIFATAMLRGEFMGFRCPIDDARVLWFDTEQDRYDTMMILRRIQQLCGWQDTQADNPKLHIYSLRSMDKMDATESVPKNRMMAIRAAVEYYRPTVVLIDGVRDLLDDFNDLKESNDLVQALMEMSADTGCAIWNVLHVNPGSDKMRGHLGTELQNKVTDIFSVTKKKGADGSVLFEVEQTAARHRDIDGFTFRIDDSQKYSVPVLLGHEEAAQAQEGRADELREILGKYVPEIGGISYTPLKNAIKAGESIGTKNAENLISEAKRYGVIEKMIGGKFRIKNIDQITQKNNENDLPF